MPPNSSCIHSLLVVAVRPGWRTSVCSVSNDIVGILWSDVHQPVTGGIESAVDYYSGVFQLLQIIPNLVTHISVEADSALMKC